MRNKFAVAVALCAVVALTVAPVSAQFRVEAARPVSAEAAHIGAAAPQALSFAVPVSGAATQPAAALAPAASAPEAAASALQPSSEISGQVVGAVNDGDTPLATEKASIGAPAAHLSGSAARQAAAAAGDGSSMDGTAKAGDAVNPALDSVQIQTIFAGLKAGGFEGIRWSSSKPEMKGDVQNLPLSIPGDEQQYAYSALMPANATYFVIARKDPSGNVTYSKQLTSADQVIDRGGLSPVPAGAESLVASPKKAAPAFGGVAGPNPNAPLRKPLFSKAGGMQWSYWNNSWAKAVRAAYMSGKGVALAATQLPGWMKSTYDNESGPGGTVAAYLIVVQGKDAYAVVYNGSSGTNVYIGEAAGWLATGETISTSQPADGQAGLVDAVQKAVAAMNTSTAQQADSSTWPDAVKKAVAAKSQDSDVTYVWTVPVVIWQGGPASNFFVVGDDADSSAVVFDTLGNKITAGEWGSDSRITFGADSAIPSGAIPSSGRMSLVKRSAPVAKKASPALRAKTPSSWTKYTADKAAVELKKIAADGDDLEYRTLGGVAISLDAADYGSLVKSGALELYKNPKGSQSDPDDDTGRWSWEPTYILQAPNGSSLDAAELDAFVSSGQKMSAGISAQMDKFHNTIHAARIQSVTDAQLAAIKAEVKAAIPVIAAQVATYVSQQTSWTAESAAFVKSRPADQQAFVKAVIDAVAPQVQGGLGIDIPTAQTIIKIDKLIFDQPAIMSIDPGADGIRIGIDATEEVAVAGTMVGYVDKLKAQLSANGIKMDTISFELYDQNLQGEVMDFLNNVLAHAIGKENIMGFATTDSDSDAQAWLEIRVRPAFVDQSKALLPKLQAQLAQYGFTNYAKNVIVASQDGPGAPIMGDENMPAGYSAAGYSYP